MFQVKQRFQSIEEYFAYDDGTDNLYELFNGELIEVPPESGENVQIANRLFLIFALLIGTDRVRGHGLELEVKQDRYYQDFGKCEQLAKSLREGFVYSGQYAPHRKRRHGNSSQEEPAAQFIVYSQTHDQIGNRILGDRLSKLISLEGLKLAAGTVLLSPFIPFLFMGEEYGEEAPFYYFISHCIMNFNQSSTTFTPSLTSSNWQKILDSADTKWMGPGALMPETLVSENLLTIPPQSFALYR